MQPNFEVPVSTKEDVDKAVRAAKIAFKDWSKATFEKRREALQAFAEALHGYKDEFVHLLVTEQGKPLRQAFKEVNESIDWLRDTPKMELLEDVVEENEDRKIINRFTPLSVSCGIVPWNFPLLLACTKIAPAIYVGSTVIIKPSPYTPYCNLKLGELGRQYFPPGVLQVLSGEDDLGPMLTAHPGIEKISFTGSSLSGKKVLESCAKTLKRTTLELGGNDAAIVCDDVDIEAAIPKVRIETAKFENIYIYISFIVLPNID